ncbi:hypothetical protein RIF29_22079 [Crotalaria pallida]|uniref:Uncharacterized protein n=1 Tax=Crotalaria pallida TaxID=3830 RepID=A0AAN9F4A4_CROPI
MDCRRCFNINMKQALDVNNTKILFFKKPIYAMVSIVGSSPYKQRTPVAKYIGNNKLIWGTTTSSAMRFYVEESKLQQNHLVLMIQLMCKRIFGSDKVIGEICVPLKELYDNYNGINNISYSTHEVVNPCDDRGHGYLQFSYEFDATLKKKEGAIANSLMQTQSHVTPSAPSLEQYLIT